MDVTTRADIERWYKKGMENKKYTHMIVVCDTFDYSDYPVFVEMGENVREKYQEYNGRDMQKVMEVYSFKKIMESQLNERRAFHFD